MSDPDQGDTATITNTNSPSHGLIALGSDQTSFVYTPNAGFSGSDSFTVQATDSHGAKSNVATVSITVLATGQTPPPPTPSNHPPTVQNTSTTTKQDTAVTIPITVSDPDQGDTATITNPNSPSHG